TSGDADDLYVITFIDPLDRNLPAWGYDVGSEKRRRDTVELAIATGRPSLTPRLDLVQEDQPVAGFLYVVPVYRNGAVLDSEAARFDALVGLVYAPIVINDVLQDVELYTEQFLEFEIYDTDDTSTDRELYSYREAGTDTPAEGPQILSRAFHTRESVIVGGRTWSIS